MFFGVGRLLFLEGHSYEEVVDGGFEEEFVDDASPFDG